MLSWQFTVHAVARRGRGQTDATIGHRLEDEAQDVAAIVRSIDETVFLLGKRQFTASVNSWRAR